MWSPEIEFGGGSAASRSWWKVGAPWEEQEESGGE